MVIATNASMDLRGIGTPTVEIAVMYLVHDDLIQTVNAYSAT